MIEKISLTEFLARLKAQGVPREHLALKCPMCATVQSMDCLIRAGVGKTQDDVERFFGFSCVGRWTHAGPHHKGTPPGRGCDWTLGGLLHLHRLVVITEDGNEYMRFEVATPEEANALMQSKATAALNFEPREPITSAPTPAAKGGVS